MIDQYGIPFLMGHAPLRTRAVRERSRRIAALSDEYFRHLVLTVDYEQRELMAEGRLAAYWAKRKMQAAGTLKLIDAALAVAKLECHKEAA